MNIKTYIAEGTRIGTADIEFTAEEVALMPKSYRASVFTSISFHVNAKTGERNDAAIKRLKSMIVKVRAAGRPVTADFPGCANAATLADIERYLNS